MVTLDYPMYYVFSKQRLATAGSWPGAEAGVSFIPVSFEGVRWLCTVGHLKPCSRYRVTVVSSS